MIQRMSKFALLILIVAILYLFISGNLISTSPFVIGIQLIAVALTIWARRSFQVNQFNIRSEPKEGRLISKGPYRYIRHPMYAAALLLVWSGILVHLTLVTLIVGLIVTIELSVRIIVEEQSLRAHFPGYQEYSNQTKKIIPFIV